MVYFSEAVSLCRTAPSVATGGGGCRDPHVTEASQRCLENNYGGYIRGLTELLSCWMNRQVDHWNSSGNTESSPHRSEWKLQDAVWSQSQQCH